MSIPHSNGCNNLYKNNICIKEKEKINDYITFRNEVFEYLNNILTYDRKE